MDQQNKQIITNNQYNDGRQSDYIINWITITEDSYQKQKKRQDYGNSKSKYQKRKK